MRGSTYGKCAALCFPQWVLVPTVVAANPIVRRSIKRLQSIVHCTISLAHQTQTARAVLHKKNHTTQHSKIADEFQKVEDGFDAAVRSYGDANKGFQAIVAEATNYSKTAFEEGTRAFQQLLGAKSVEQAVEIQSQYVKKAYEAHIAQMTKLGEMYVSLAQNAFKPQAR